MSGKSEISFLLLIALIIIPRIRGRHRNPLQAAQRPLAHQRPFGPQDPALLPDSLRLSILRPRTRPLADAPQITDQPRVCPSAPLTPEEREKHVILTLRAPPAAYVADVTPLVAALFQLVDALGKINLRPETKAKLRKGREELDRTLKIEAEKEQKEEVRIQPCYVLTNAR